MVCGRIPHGRGTLRVRRWKSAGTCSRGVVLSSTLCCRPPSSQQSACLNLEGGRVCVQSPAPGRPTTLVTYPRHPLPRRPQELHTSFESSTESCRVARGPNDDYKPRKQQKTPAHLDGECVLWRFDVYRQGAPATSINGAAMRITRRSCLSDLY